MRSRKNTHVYELIDGLRGHGPVPGPADGHPYGNTNSLIAVTIQH